MMTFEEEVRSWEFDVASASPFMSAAEASALLHRCPPFILSESAEAKDLFSILDWESQNPLLPTEPAGERLLRRFRDLAAAEA